MNLKQMIFAATIAAVLPMQANAATATTSINVSVNVITPTASISVSGPIDFGTILNTDNINIDRTTTLTVNVTQGIPYTITMDGGLNPNTFFKIGRRLVDPNRGVNGGTVGYNIFTNLLRTQVWGDGGAFFTNPGLARTGTGVNETIPVYAQLSLAGTQLTGNYTDTVTATITY